MKSLSLLASTFAVLAAGASVRAQSQSEQSDRQPNFLVIVADDLGYSDLGSFGGEIQTPNLDALAARGMKFTQFHASPTCSPTRAMLLTGLDNHEAGLGTMAEVLTSNQSGHPGYEGYLRSDAATLAEVLENAGYRTLFSGKWHLGLTLTQDPSQRGFQRSFAMLQASHNHFGLQVSTDPTKGFVYREDGRTLTALPPGFYSSDFFASKLIEQLRESRDKDGAKPFFAYLAFTAPHWPLQAPKETIAKYAHRYDAGYEVLRDERLRRQEALGLLKPDVVPHPFSAPCWQSLSTEEQAVSARRMAVYAAMVDRIDFNVGRVVQALRDSGEFDNTVVLFLSDNGADGMKLESQTLSAGARARYDAADNRLGNIGSATSYSSIGPGWAEATSAPSWSFKGAETEGGTRVVAFLTGQGVPQGISTHFVSVMDVLPTILGLAKVSPPGGTARGEAFQPIRGVSWVDWLKGRSKSVYSANATIEAELLGERAVRQGDWKLLDPGDGRWRLFNIRHDPGETADLARDEPDRTASLVETWRRYAQEVKVVLPSETYKPPNLF